MIIHPLSGLLKIESDHTVCFDRQGDEIAWPQFVRTVAALASALREIDAHFWAVDTSDSFEYGCALFACWSAGKTPVLAPAHLLADSQVEVEFDGLIVSSSQAATAKPVISFDQLKPAELADTVISSTSEMVLFTSGSTGQPMQVRRTILNIEAELDVLESMFGETIENGRIYSTVSHRHIYGLLFRLLWPLVTQRAFATFNFDYPENLLSDVGSDSALVSSPALLKRVGHLDEKDAVNWRIVFSSGGMLPDYAAADAHRLLGTCPVEVLGSTETSGVAWRQQGEQGSSELWHTLPEVRIRQDEDGFMEVSSPFMGLSSWHRMGDKIRLETNRSFELLGRGDHIVKIEDKRVSLAEIEQCATAVTGVVDAAATALDDGSRQYVGLVLVLDDDGQTELQSQGRKEHNEHIKQSLRARLDPVALPRKYRYVDAIPVNPQGKRQPAVIRALFD
jgi:acyl-coenzyme A synthetase/AMP-(fatty) acid ligase